MRMHEVDERDSSWENDAPRFRIYVFEDAENAVSTFDLLGATVEEALEAARVQSGDDRHLWSLALVHDDGRAGRGLVWLSGNDYNDVPPSVDEASYWRARGVMQDRYLSARSRAGDAVVLPTGERLIRFFPEWGADLPLWESFTENYPVKRSALPLPATLEIDLAAWNMRWQELSGTREPGLEARWHEWEREGVRLRAHLQSALDGIAELRPEFIGGSPR
jgi:hypothetical protein